MFGSLFLICAVSFSASGSDFGPFETPAAPVTAEVRKADPPSAGGSPSSNPLYLSFEVYRLTITVFDGPRCAHRPTCAAYGVQAVERHGLLGFFLAIDRLWRDGESSALRPLPLVWDDERPYFLDPLRESSFWLERHP